MAQAQEVVAEIFQRMHSEVARFLSEGRDEAEGEVEEGRNLVAEAVEALSEELRAALEEIFEEYPVLMLWAEMKINEVLDQATESLTQIVESMESGAAENYAFIQYALPSILGSYQSHCLRLLDQAEQIGENGLDAGEAEMMVTELVQSMNGADAAYASEQTERIHDLLDGYGVDLTGETDDQTWEYAESLVILTAVSQIDNRLTEAYEGWVQEQAHEAARRAFNIYRAEMGGNAGSFQDFAADFTQSYVERRMDDPEGRTMFERVYGEIDFQRMSYEGIYTDSDGDEHKYWAEASYYPTIRVYSNAFGAYGSGRFSAVQNVIHELGHGFDRQADDPRNDLPDRRADPRREPRIDPDLQDER